jgi:hypothetical protein
MVFADLVGDGIFDSVLGLDEPELSGGIREATRVVCNSP